MSVKNWQFIISKNLHVSGMTLYPFILVAHRQLLKNKIFINHEHIHLRQQIELLIVPFYILYACNYLFNRVYYREHDNAYRNIVFEREAYANEANLQYLKARKLWAWRMYVSKK
jgi:hypothetical protein